MVAYASPTQNKLKMPGAYDPAPGPIPDASAAAYVPGKTAPAPAPKANALAAKASPSMGSPYMQPKAQPRNALVADTIDGFMRGFNPQQYEKDVDRRKTEGVDKMKKTLALIEQQRALPMEQRAQWWEANVDGVSEIMGQDMRAMPVDPNQFSDQALDGHRAMLSAQLGIAPEKPAGPDYQFLQGPDGAIARGDKTSGGLEVMQQGMPKAADPVKWDRVTDATGQVWQIDPYTGEKRKVDGLRERVPDSGGGGTNDLSFRTLTPEEVAQRGYTKGTVVQVDSRGKEYRTASPSTAQTGQPTESERAAGLHAQVSLNGLRQLMAMEGEGYNRAGVVEQMFGGTFGLEKERLYDQAADEFIDGYLRAMTGAAATKQEIDNYKQQWFPKWGDTAAVIAQKSAGRLNAIQAMKSKAGRSWNPNWDALMNQMQGQGPGPMSGSPMQLATDQGAETVPGMNWNGAQMNYQSAPAGDLSGYSTEDLQRMLAEAEGQ